MKDDATFLLDMLVAARKIQKFSVGLTQETFNQSELHQSALIRELQVIGEAARLISEECKSAHPEIEWDKIAGMRNRLIHEYFRVSLRIVWQTTQNDIVPLIARLETLVPKGGKEYPQ